MSESRKTEGVGRVRAGGFDNGFIGLVEEVFSGVELGEVIGVRVDGEWAE